MEEILKHRGHLKDKGHQHHHHLNLFHFHHHHHHHSKEQQQQNVIVEKYREVSSAIDEPTHESSSSSASTGVHLKITVCSDRNKCVNYQDLKKNY